MCVLVGIDVPLMMSIAEMTTKFNQEMYARLRVRKNKPLSSIGQKRPRVMKEVVETTVSTPVTSEPKAASPTVSVEDITPRPKRTHASDKGKSKADWNVWDDQGLGETIHITTEYLINEEKVVMANSKVDVL